MKQVTCSVVIPVYNSAGMLEELVKRLDKVLSKAAAEYEVILVNDGSSDSSREIIDQFASKSPWIIGIHLMRNYGQHNATLCGIRHANYDVIITMDDDLQNPPEEITKILKKLLEGYDVVYGVPNKRERDWWRSIFSKIVKRAISAVMGLRTVRDIGAFKGFRTHLRKSFEDFNGPDVLVDVLLSWGTNRFASVAVNEAPRLAGRSNYNFFQLIKVSLLVLTSYTTIPLRIASFLGFGFTLFGMVILIYVLSTYFVVGSIEGFTFLASTIVIFSGVQLFALGIIGEYLARVFSRTGGKPAYTIAETTGKARQ